ncbi:MAG: DUF3054 domain-containing protein [Chloroflexota bacterium]|nr:DUF3054 domain-containing protein [Chloroflexota bacterium]
MRDHGAFLLALGDLAAFAAFGAIGMASHGDPFTAKSVARAIVLFPAAWFLIAPWFGAFSQSAVADQGWGPHPLGLVRVALVWLPAGVIALVARAAIFDRALFNAFFVVALVGYGLFLVAWRTAYSRIDAGYWLKW